VHSDQLVLGGGLRWHLSPRFAVGVEVDSFDKDASFVGIDLTTGIGRFGKD
jgi:hypothetical protein